MKVSGCLQKMAVELASPVNYQLRLDDDYFPLNPLIGQSVRLEYQGSIRCLNCNRKTNKSFNQGYCYPCFKKLARCDTCMIKPETCHFEQGSCREPDWAADFCFKDHIVYLANSSGLKVGITRATQLPTRWIDQGAIQAIPLLRVSDRLLSGQVEVYLAETLADKTNWRAMLKAEVTAIDLVLERQKRKEILINYIQNNLQVFDIKRYSFLEEKAVEIRYPVLEYPVKVSSFNFDKTPIIEGQLMGIKGQYLILDTGVLNLRKFAGYQIQFSSHSLI